MNWKGRQMFGGKPSGIVQMMGGGMTPYPTHVMPDGTVMPGATHGPGYEVGGVVPETKLFEEGDSDINSALNTMVGFTQPSVPDMPASNGMAMGGGDMMMDQGSGYENAVVKLKEEFKNEIRNYVSETGKENLGKYLKDMNMTYSNALEALKKNYKITVSNPSDELLNEEFLQEVMIMADQQEIPKMENGGLVDEITDQAGLDKYKIPLPLEVWLNLNKTQKNAYLMNSLAKNDFEGTQGLDTYNANIQDLVQQAEDLIPEIGQAAGSKYKTKEGGTGVL